LTILNPLSNRCSGWPQRWHRR